MSTKYPGGFITKDYVAPTPSSAKGVWTLDQQMQAQKTGTWPFGGPFTYIEDVFSTYLYTGNSSTQTITNGIDLAGKGGLVWLKYRSGSAGSIYHHVYDSARGKSGNASYNYIYTNTTGPQGTGASGPTSFNTDGFSLNDYLNESSIPYVSWTFRKAPKWFDVQTWTGSGSNRTISHELGSVPGCIIVKRTDTAGAWQVYHRSLANTEYTVLNTTAAKATGATRWNSTTPTSTEFSLGTDATVNASSGTYVAYIFAHNAGGFGATATDNVISCGSFTTDGSANATVELGWEPQFVMTKTINVTGNWYMADTMRGWLGGVRPTSNQILYADNSNAEANSSVFLGTVTATGFKPAMDAGSTSIYIAIRRGPMKVPTDATKVFNPAFFGTNGVTGYLGQPADMNIQTHRNLSYSFNPVNRSRLVGGGTRLTTSNADAEVVDSQNFWDNMTGMQPSGETSTLNSTVIDWTFARAPGFFDVVCYTGTGAAMTVAHNLAAVPELMIVKGRSAVKNWVVYPNSPAQYLYLNAADQSNAGGTPWWNDTAPTSSVFSLGTGFQGNQSGVTYVAYLFATCPGVSKVGSYTGTGTTLAINCGFTTGARFVLIKRTDASGDWYVWDSARGIVAGNDPYLLLNSTAVEVTSTDYVDAAASGFEITSTAPAAINASGGSYIFLAIA